MDRLRKAEAELMVSRVSCSCSRALTACLHTCALCHVCFGAGPRRGSTPVTAARRHSSPCLFPCCHAPQHHAAAIAVVRKRRDAALAGDALG